MGSRAVLEGGGLAERFQKNKFCKGGAKGPIFSVPGHFRFFGRETGPKFFFFFHGRRLYRKIILRFSLAGFFPKNYWGHGIIFFSKIFFRGVNPKRKSQFFFHFLIFFFGGPLLGGKNLFSFSFFAFFSFFFFFFLCLV